MSLNSLVVSLVREGLSLGVSEKRITAPSYSDKALGAIASR